MGVEDSRAETNPTEPVDFVTKYYRPSLVCKEPGATFGEYAAYTIALMVLAFTAAALLGWL